MGIMPRGYIDLGNLLAILHLIVVRHGSQKDAAKALGISAQYLNDVLLKRREPGEKLLRALGYQRVVLYTPIEKKR